MAIFLHISNFYCTFAAKLGDMHQIIVVIGFVGVAVLLLSVGVILRKDHTFRSQHIHENERMKENKIHCATAQDREARRDNPKKIKV